MKDSKLTYYLDSLQSYGIPGCSCMVYHHHEPIYHHTAGYTDTEKTKPTELDTTYWLYSATKLVTCTAVMQLVERGLIFLDDPVDKYLPEYGNLMVKHETGTKPAQNRMTIRHLMSMQSGLNYNINTPSLTKAVKDSNGQISTREFIRALSQEPLDFEPGTRFQYSLSHDVLGALVEAVSGMSFDQYLDKSIFMPLNMSNTGFELTADRRALMSQQYRYDVLSRTAKPIHMENGYVLSPNYKSGGAGLISTVQDFILFLDALSNGGAAYNGNRIIAAESIDLMRTDQLNGESVKDFAAFGRAGYSYGLGVRVHIDSKASCAKSPLGEFGWDGAAGAYALIDPENHLAIFYVQHVLGCEYAYQTIHPTIRDLTYEML